MSDKDKLDLLISACNFMLDVCDLVQFRDAAGLRLYHTHPATLPLSEAYSLKNSNIFFPVFLYSSESKKLLNFVFSCFCLSSFASFANSFTIRPA